MKFNLFGKRGAKYSTLILLITAIILTSLIFIFINLKADSDNTSSETKLDDIADKYTYNTALEFYIIYPVNKPANSDIAAKMVVSKKVDIYYTSRSVCENWILVNNISEEKAIQYLNTKEAMMFASDDPELMESAVNCIVVHNKEKDDIEIELYVYPYNVISKIPRD